MDSYRKDQLIKLISWVISEDSAFIRSSLEHAGICPDKLPALRGKVQSIALDDTEEHGLAATNRRSGEYEVANMVCKIMEERESAGKDTLLPGRWIRTDPRFHQYQTSRPDIGATCFTMVQAIEMPDGNHAVVYGTFDLKDYTKSEILSMAKPYPLKSSEATIEVIAKIVFESALPVDYDKQVICSTEEDVAAAVLNVMLAHEPDTRRL